ncbi:MAG: TlpA disulfide reductase family protein [Bacillota bacterium]
MRIKIAIAAVVALVVVVVLMMEPLRARDAAPGFKLVDLDGRHVQLADFKGKAVVLKFWTSLCSACIRALPELDAVARQFGDQAVVLAVNVLDEPRTVQRVVEEYQVTLRVLLDSDGAVAKRYKVRGYPTHAFINPNGKLVAVIPGYMNAEALAIMVHRALKP